MLCKQLEEDLAFMKNSAKETIKDDNQEAQKGPTKEDSNNIIPCKENKNKQQYQKPMNELNRFKRSQRIFFAPSKNIT